MWVKNKRGSCCRETEQEVRWEKQQERNVMEPKKRAFHKVPLLPGTGEVGIRGTWRAMISPVPLARTLGEQVVECSERRKY